MVPLVDAEDALGVAVLLVIGVLLPLLVVVVCDAATGEVDVGAGLLDCTGSVLVDVVWAVLLLAGDVLVGTAGVSGVGVVLAACGVAAGVAGGVTAGVADGVTGGGTSAAGAGVVAGGATSAAGVGFVVGGAGGVGAAVLGVRSTRALGWLGGVHADG